MENIENMEKAIISSWLDSGEAGDVLQLRMSPVDSIRRIIEDAGWIMDEFEGNTNGWQVDFWYYFSKGENRVCLAGSLWYGEFTLTKEKK